MKQITAEDIKPKYRFILDMYGVLDRFVENWNNDDEPSDITILNKKPFYNFIYGSHFFLFPEIDLWNAVAEQDESKLLPNSLEEEEERL
jgi:hypothetical protein